MDRRTFVKGTVGSAGLFLQGFGARAQSDASAPALPPIETHGLPPAKPSPLGMPGLFPGRVVEISNPKSIVKNRISQPMIKNMLGHVMMELTGENSVPAAWAKFIEPTDVVGIKINPSGAPACCSSPEIVREIASAVQSVGVPAQNIVVYDRYAYEIDVGSYQALDTTFSQKSFFADMIGPMTAVAAGLRCQTDAEARYHAMEGHCVAVLMPDSSQFVGEPISGPIKRCRENNRD